MIVQLKNFNKIKKLFYRKLFSLFTEYLFFVNTNFMGVASEKFTIFSIHDFFDFNACET
jgi:hypothetical protein